MLRRLFKAALLLVLLVGLFYAVVAVLESRGYFERQMREQFGRYVGGSVDVGGAELRVAARQLEASELTLRVEPDAEPAVVVPEMVFHLPLTVPEEGPYMPDQIQVWRPELRLEERADGTLSPLHLIKPWVPTKFIPTVSIADGTVLLSGDGPLSRFLDTLLRDGLERRIRGVEIATFPEPMPSPQLFGFDGRLELPGVSEVQVRGSLARSNAFHLLARIKDLELSDPNLIETLDERLARRFTRHVVKGNAALTFTYRTPPAEVLGDQPGEIRSTLVLNDGALRHEALTGLVEGIRGEASFDGQHLFLHQLVVPDPAGTIEMDGVLNDLFEDAGWRLTMRSDSMSFQDSLIARIVQPELRQAIDDYSPVGTARMFCEVSADPGGELSARWSIVPLVASGSFTGHPDEGDGPVGFPYRLDDLVGEVSGEGNRLTINRVRGKHNGGKQAQVEGWVEILPVRNLFEINVTADDAPIDAELIAALDYTEPGSAELVHRFQPQGLVDVAVSAWRDPGGGETRTRGRITTENARALFDAVPIPMERIKGAVEFEDDIFRILDVTGHNGEATFVVSGTVDARQESVGLDLKVSATNVPANEKALWDALRDNLGEGAGDMSGLIDLLRPEGSFDLELELKQTPGGELRFRALIFPRGIDLLPSWFPVPLTGVLGRVVLGNLHPHDEEDTRFYVLVDHLEGRHSDSVITGFGHYGEGLVESLQVQGDHVELTTDLLGQIGEAVISSAEEKGRELARLLDVVEADGTLSFRYRHGEAAQRSAEGDQLKGDDVLDLYLEEVDFRAPVLPGEQVSDLVGTIRFDFAGDRLDAVQLAGVLPRGLGQVRTERMRLAMDDQGIFFSGDVDFPALPFDQDLTLLMTPTVGSYFRSKTPGGHLAVHLDHLELRLPFSEDGSTVSPAGVRFDGQVELADCSIGLPVRLEKLSGRLDLEGEGDLSRPGNLRLGGTFRDVALHAGRVGLEGLSATLLVTEDRIELSEVTGPFAGGTLPKEQNHLVIDTSARGSVRGNVALRDASLRELLTQIAPAGRDVAGFVSLDFGFKGVGDNLASLTGDGLMEIREGELWDLPVLAALYSFSLGLFLGEEGRPTFENGTIDFRLTEGKIVLRRFELEAPVARTPVGMMLTGKGVVGPTGVDLRVVPQVILIDTLITPALNLLKRGLINYRIHGPLGNPRVTYWNAAADVMSPNQDVTRLPRLAPRGDADWKKRF